MHLSSDSSRGAAHEEDRTRHGRPGGRERGGEHRHQHPACERRLRERTGLHRHVLPHPGTSQLHGDARERGLTQRNFRPRKRHRSGTALRLATSGAVFMLRSMRSIIIQTIPSDYRIDCNRANLFEYPLSAYRPAVAIVVLGIFN